ncbi:MAG TPA: MATE family efflux transporter [Candidatus Acetatifactor stercoripullorum]|uniref:Multidrug export protein MepA n=1 Tax=Candidatus Acetatifactor stercoripullorum TaxID=2838414 RepID=A0A9D1UBB7_9FIRM|nr:MATE family efflux transporter [uncultured Acetatifactor sp.]HIW80983.1 MATE family efflux transporter [Candidatus Acetatifactor stercoripullorum]
MKVSRMNQQEKIEYMLNEPATRLVCQMAVPTIISMLVSSFYNMADTFFVGRISTQATAAVGVVFSVMAFIQACGFFFGHGSGNYISRKLGAGEFEDANKMAATGFVSAFLTGIFAGVLGLIFLEPLSRALGSTPTILPYTKEYLGIILLGTPFMMSSLVLNNQLRFQGSASYAMVGIVTGAVLNIGLDPLFIFVFDMGVAGAALATTISQIVSFVLLVLMTRKGGNIRIHLRDFSPSWYYFKEIIRGGLPSLCRQGLGSVAQICMNWAAGFYGAEFGDAAIAAMSIVNRVAMFANSALIGFGQGFQPVCGMNYGAGKYHRVREAFFFCVKYAFVFLLVLSAVGFIFARPLVMLFRREDAEVIRIGALALRLQCLAFPLNAWIVMSNMMLQSIGKAVRASIVAAARQGLFFLPFIWILPKFFGLLGVQMCQTWSDVCSFLIAVPLGISVLREMAAAGGVEAKAAGTQAQDM